MTAIEEIERREKLLSLLFKAFIVILILTMVIFTGWLITWMNQTEGGVGISSPAAFIIRGTWNIC